MKAEKIASSGTVRWLSMLRTRRLATIHDGTVSRPMPIEKAGAR